MSVEAQAALADVRAAGVPVVVVTGRSWRSAVPVAGELGADAVICSNGALVWDLARGCVARHRGFPRGAALAAVAAVAERHADVAWAWEADGSFGFEPAFAARIAAPGRRWDDGVAGPLGRTLPATLTKLTGHLASGVRPGPDLFEAVRLASGGRATATTSGAGWLDVGPSGVDKATTLAEVAEGYGIGAAEVVALGDEHNDISMLRWAGLGIAMAHAPAEVQAVAARTAPGGVDAFAATVRQLLDEGALAGGDLSPPPP